MTDLAQRIAEEHVARFEHVLPPEGFHARREMIVQLLAESLAAEAEKRTERDTKLRDIINDVLCNEEWQMGGESIVDLHEALLFLDPQKEAE